MLILFEQENNDKCKQLKSYLAKEDFEPDETYVIDESNQETAKMFNITVYPTLLFTEDNDTLDEIDRLESFNDITEVAKYLDL